MREVGQIERSGSRRALFVALTALLFAAFASQLVYHTLRISPTVDEAPHILAGYRHWQCGDFGINPEHPPLLKLLATAPLNFLELKDPPWECGSKLTSKFDMFSYGNTFLGENGIDRILIPTRLASERDEFAARGPGVSCRLGNVRTALTRWSTVFYIEISVYNRPKNPGHR